MAKMVSPARRPCNVWQIAASVCGSSELVTSSRISSLGRRAKALAIAIRCRWPPESAVPRSAKRSLDIGLIHLGIAKRHVPQDRFVQQERFLRHVADHPAPLPEVNLLQWHIVNQNFASLWAEQADNQ